MDHARCTCLVRWDPVLKKNIRYTVRVNCPVHGDLVGKDPVVAWRLSENDRIFLRSGLISTEDL